MKLPFGKKKDGDADEKTSVYLHLFNKITSLFNPEPQKQKVLRHEDFNSAGDTYYASVSVGYKITQRILIIFLVIFLTVSIVTNFSLITYDNFFYLIKDFSNAVDIESSNYDTLSYSSDPRHFFALYRGGLAIASPASVSVFTATGRRTLQVTSEFSSPCIEVSDKYVLVYDTAGTSFSVFNSFSRIYSETFEYPITDACFDKDGTLAVVTRDISHKSMVHVYDEDFNKLFTVPSNDYTFDVAINGERDNMAICYYDIGDGSGRSRITVRKLSDTKEVSTILIEGEFLLKCAYISSDRLAVATDRSVRIYDESYDELARVEYSNASVSGFFASEHGIAVSYTENSKNYATVFDNSGNLLYNEIIDEAVGDIGIYENFVFLRTDSGVIRIDPKTSQEQFLPSDQGKMLLYSQTTALVCGDAKAEYLVFDDLS